MTIKSSAMTNKLPCHRLVFNLYQLKALLKYKFAIEIVRGNLFRINHDYYPCCSKYFECGYNKIIIIIYKVNIYLR